MIRSFPPAADTSARILVLGSMPGGESLRREQYYAFPHNVFWRIAGILFHFDPALPYAARLAALNANGVALWDILQACEREGSLDTAIRKPVPNDIPGLLTRCPAIRRIVCNGGASAKYLKRFYPELQKMTCVLPSTSPAAARLCFEEKLALWRTALSVDAF